MELPPNKQTLHAFLKALIGAEIALGLLAIPLMFFQTMMTESAFNEIGQTTNVSDSEMLSFAFGIMFLVVLLPAIIASWIGLFKLRNWARWVYLIVLCSGCLLAIPMGCFTYEVTWGLSTAIMDLMGPIEGIILGISFLSPLAQEFTSAKQQSQIS